MVKPRDGLVHLTFIGQPLCDGSFFPAFPAPQPGRNRRRLRCSAEFWQDVRFVALEFLCSVWS